MMHYSTWRGFDWNGQRLLTYSDILKGAQSCTHPEEAAHFKVTYGNALGSLQTASSNLGYLFGYLDEAERTRLYGLFMDVVHPVFGASFR